MSLQVPVALVVGDPDAGASERVAGTPRKPRPTAHLAQLSPAPTAAAQHLAPLSPGQLAGPQLSLPPSQAEHTYSWRPPGVWSPTCSLPLSGLPLTCWDPGREPDREETFQCSVYGHQGKLLIPLGTIRMAPICFKELLPLSIRSNLEAGESSAGPLDGH